MNYNPHEIFGITKEEAALYRLRFLSARMDELSAKAEELWDKYAPWEKRNLKQRKETLAQIRDLEVRLMKWQTYYTACGQDSEWFITDRIAVAEHYLSKARARHQFLKDIARERKEEEEAVKSGQPIPEKKYKTYDIDRIKEIPIPIVLSQAGYNVIPTGTERAKAICPFHHDTNPSLNINLKENYFKCFACDEGGDVIKLYQKLHGVGFQEALKELNYLI